MNARDEAIVRRQAMNRVVEVGAPQRSERPDPDLEHVDVPF
jgi:hypothetical protein